MQESNHQKIDPLYHKQLEQLENLMAELERETFFRTNYEKQNSSLTARNIYLEKQNSKNTEIVEKYHRLTDSYKQKFSEKDSQTDQWQPCDGGQIKSIIEGLKDDIRDRANYFTTSIEIIKGGEPQSPPQNVGTPWDLEDSTSPSKMKSSPKFQRVLTQTPKSAKDEKTKTDHVQDLIGNGNRVDLLDEIRLESDRIITPDHKILVRGKDAKVKQMEVDDMINTPKKPPLIDKENQSSTTIYSHLDDSPRKDQETWFESIGNAMSKGLSSGLGMFQPQDQKSQNSNESHKLKIDDGTYSENWVWNIIPNYFSGKGTVNLTSALKRLIKANLDQNGFLPEHRALLWDKLCRNNLKITETLFESLRAGIDFSNPHIMEASKMIELDLLRTYPYFNRSEKFWFIKREAKEILLCWHLYRPDISYVQGMSSVAIFLQFNVGPYAGFKIFANLILGSEVIHACYTFDTDAMEKYGKVLNHLIYKNSPNVYEKFTENGQSPSIQYLELFYTMFTRFFNLDLLKIIWDFFFLKGEIVFFRLIVYVYHYLNDDIVEVDCADLLVYIRKNGTLMNRNLVKHLDGDLLTKKEFYKLLEHVKLAE